MASCTTEQLSYEWTGAASEAVCLISLLIDPWIRQTQRSLIMFVLEWQQDTMISQDSPPKFIGMSLFIDKWLKPIFNDAFCVLMTLSYLQTLRLSVCVISSLKSVKDAKGKLHVSFGLYLLFRKYRYKIEIRQCAVVP